METIPEIGSRVTYFVESRARKTSCTGVVVKHYPGHSGYDEEECESYEVPDCVAVKVDTLPEWWCYPDTDVFAPSIDEIEPA